MKTLWVKLHRLGLGLKENRLHQDLGEQLDEKEYRTF